ncbi:MAG: hypothetical protein ACKN85_02165 [Pirellula sp.]
MHSTQHCTWQKQLNANASVAFETQRLRKGADRAKYRRFLVFAVKIPYWSEVVFEVLDEFEKPSWTFESVSLKTNEDSIGKSKSTIGRHDLVTTNKVAISSDADKSHRCMA